MLHQPDWEEKEKWNADCEKHCDSNGWYNWSGWEEIWWLKWPWQSLFWPDIIMLKTKRTVYKHLGNLVFTVVWVSNSETIFYVF